MRFRGKIHLKEGKVLEGKEWYIVIDIQTRMAILNDLDKGRTPQGLNKYEYLVPLENIIYFEKLE